MALAFFQKNLLSYKNNCQLKGLSMPQTPAFAAFDDKSPLREHMIERRTLGPHDILIDIDYCGVCHTDLHFARNDWGRTVYPIVPGHEIVGTISALGSAVSNRKMGDFVGVGCMVDACRSCTSCDNNLEQFCEKGAVMTYGSPDYHHDNELTQGGYARQIVVQEHFVLSIPKSLKKESVAPLLCAGITTYSPLKKWNIKKNDVVGIIGLGGLGHMGVKFAAAMGAHVVIITTSPEKGDDAKKLGAHDVLISHDEKAMAQHANHFDFLLNTIPSAHDVNPYMPLLKNEKTMVLVGGTPIELHSMNLIFGRKNISGSLIGGIKETQEMLDFCGQNNVLPDVEPINMQDINKAYERMIQSDVHYRFVIDMQSIKTNP